MKPETLISKRLDRLYNLRLKLASQRAFLDEYLKNREPEEYAELKSLESSVADLEKVIRDDTVALGHTVRGQELTAAYTSEGVSWDTPTLLDLAATYPVILEASKPRKPYARIV